MEKRLFFNHPPTGILRSPKTEVTIKPTMFLENIWGIYRHIRFLPMGFIVTLATPQEPIYRYLRFTRPCGKMEEFLKKLSEGNFL